MFCTSITSLYKWHLSTCFAKKRGRNWSLKESSRIWKSSKRCSNGREVIPLVMVRWVIPRGGCRNWLVKEWNRSNRRLTSVSSWTRHTALTHTRISERIGSFKSSKTHLELSPRYGWNSLTGAQIKSSPRSKKATSANAVRPLTPSPRPDFSTYPSPTSKLFLMFTNFFAGRRPTQNATASATHSTIMSWTPMGRHSTISKRFSSLGPGRRSQC